MLSIFELNHFRFTIAHHNLALILYFSLDKVKLLQFANLFLTFIVPWQF